MSRRSRRAARRGFTLLEVVVVVTIIALLAALVAPRLLGQIGKNKRKIAGAEAAALANALNLYLADNGLAAPPQDLTLDVLVEGDDPYLESADDLVDPWGNPYELIVPGEVNFSFDVVSRGADGEPGGEGDAADITN